MDKPSKRRLKRERARARRAGGAAETQQEPIQQGHEQREPNRVASQSPGCAVAQDPGASGTSQEQAPLTRTDMLMIRRALREDWPIAPERRSQLMDELHRIATAPIEVPADSDNPERQMELSARAKIAAARTILAADGVNVRREAIDVRAELPVKTAPVHVSIDNRRVVLMLPDNKREVSHG